MIAYVAILLLQPTTALVGQERTFDASQAVCSACLRTRKASEMLSRDGNQRRIGGVTAAWLVGDSLFFSHSSSLGRVHLARISQNSVVEVKFPKFGPGGPPTLIGGLMYSPSRGLVMSDPLTNRLLVVSRVESQVSEFNLQFAPSAVSWLANGEFVVNGLSRTRELVGLPLHRISVTGSRLASFGGVEGLFRPDVAFFNEYFVSSGDGKTTWTAKKNSYALEHWSENGTRLKTLRGRLPWFRDWMSADAWPKDVVPHPRISGIFADTGSLIWIAIVRPKPDYLSNLVPVQTEEGETTVVKDIGRAVTTEIQLVDVRRELLVARTTVDAFVSGFVAPGAVIAQTGNLVQGETLQVLRFTIVK